MSFRPSIRSFLSDIRPVRPLLFEQWPGAVADFWEVEVGRGGYGEYVARDPRIVAVLGDAESSLRLQCAGQPDATPVRIAYIPGGLRARSSFERDGALRHVDLHYDRGRLAERLRAAGLDPDRMLDRPILLGSAPAARAIAELIGEEIRSGAANRLVLESLTLALLAKVLTTPQAEDGARPGRTALTFGQLDRLDQLMRRQMHRRLPICEMAAHIGLSESWFSHAYRRSRGETPQQSLRRLRIDAAKRLLESDCCTGLAEVASAVGFADQAHFTRAFRTATGETPGGWRRGAAWRQDQAIRDSSGQDRAG